MACSQPEEPTDLLPSDPPARVGDTGTVEPDPTGDTGAPDPTGDTGEPPVDEDWLAFEAAREGFLYELAVPTLLCIEVNETPNPVFHGCVDWHSAVHATWALLAVHRLTGDPLYLDAANDVLDPAGLVVELEHMRDGSLAAEVPYGFAWMLVLAREREMAGDLDLVPLADEAEQQLGDWVDGLSRRAASAAALSDEYGNLSWALLNLWEQAVWNGDTVRQAHWEEVVRRRLLPLDAQCPLEDDQRGFGFFPACLHRARTIVTTLPEDEARAWMDGFLLPDFEMPPRTRIRIPHQAGQNFSRSWGLWSLWSATGDPAYRDAYLDHVTSHLEHPEYWAEDYRQYAHWVPQFGVYGIALSWE